MFLDAYIFPKLLYFPGAMKTSDENIGLGLICQLQ